MLSGLNDAALQFSTALQAEHELRDSLYEKNIPFSSVIIPMPLNGVGLLSAVKAASAGTFWSVTSMILSRQPICRTLFATGSYPKPSRCGHLPSVQTPMDGLAPDHVQKQRSRQQETLWASNAESWVALFLIHPGAGRRRA